MSIVRILPDDWEELHNTARISIIDGLKVYRARAKKTVQEVLDRVKTTNFRDLFLASLNEGFGGFVWAEEPLLGAATRTEWKMIRESIEASLRRHGLMGNDQDLVCVHFHKVSGKIAIIPSLKICKRNLPHDSIGIVYKPLE